MSLRLTLCPRGIERQAAAPAGSLPLAGGTRAFAFCEAVVREDGRELAREVVPVAALLDWAERFGPGAAAQAADLLARSSAPRPAYAGLDLGAPRVMGVINVTPDSFSDGGERFEAARAVDDGLAMAEAGAAILDVGGESTRPGAAPIAEAEELRRVLPVVSGLAEAGALVSIDTRRAGVMAAALDAGARIVNDVTALAGDPDSLALVAGRGVAVVLMHMQGEPRTMQAAPSYADAPLDVYDVLAERVAACEAAGIARARIAVDPGIGFGKAAQHSLQILDHMALYQGLGCPVLLGVSRKSFIGKLSRGEPAKSRLPGSLAAALAGLERGVQIVRTHDVAETLQAIAIWSAIATAGR
ncbi:MAG: dihydropteroate synthase [Kiloniellales bacterium]